jgi:2'-5' RNA ligase
LPQRSGLRLFFALWPEPGLRAALAAIAADLRSACGGRAPPPANLHLTLAFIGSVAESRLPALKDIAASLVVPPFDLSLDRIGCWRAQRLLWAAPRQCPPELSALAQALRDGLRARGFAVERRAFKPHVTLLRDIATQPPQSDCHALHWRARSIVLACSEPAPRGVRYRIVGEWPFAGG